MFQSLSRYFIISGTFTYFFKIFIRRTAKLTKTPIKGSGYHVIFVVGWALLALATRLASLCFVCACIIKSSTLFNLSGCACGRGQKRKRNGV